MLLAIVRAAIAVIQLVDIILHIATNQAEPIRIASNLIVLLWLGVLSARVVAPQFRMIAVGVIALYLALNLIFLATAGITNAAQGGGLRVTLLAFVALTTALSAVLAYRWQPKASK